MSEDFDHDELDSLLETAVRQAFESTITRAQRNDEQAKAFLKDYKDYYLGKSKLSDELCTKTAAYIDQTLEQDPHHLHPALHRWTTGLTALGAIASPFIGLAAKNIWYAAGMLAGAGIMYLTRRVVRAISQKDAKKLQFAVAAAPHALKPYLKESKEYMGNELWLYGALHYDEMQQAHDDRTQRRPGSAAPSKR